MSIKISLSDFLTFNASKSQQAKRSVVSKIQNRDTYSPAFDFWRDLRTGIQKLPDNQNISTLERIAEAEPENKQRKHTNYVHAVASFKRYTRRNSPAFFSTTNIKSTWSMEDKMKVKVAPEVGMTIDGTDYLVKFYFKVKSDDVSITKRNVTSTLAMVKTALESSGETRPCAIFNIQTGKLITEYDIDIADALIDLDLEALNFVNTWNRILPPDHS